MPKGKPGRPRGGRMNVGGLQLLEKLHLCSTGSQDQPAQCLSLAPSLTAKHMRLASQFVLLVLPLLEYVSV